MSKGVKNLSQMEGALRTARRNEPLEFEQLVIRYLIGIFTTGCAVISWSLGFLAPWQITALTLFIPTAWLIALAFMVHFAIWPHRTVERRTATIPFDAATLSLFIYFGGEPASIFFPVYLWVILGNGFRFGIAYMYGSMAVNAAFFLLIAVQTPNWRADWAFAAGLVLSLILIPLYVSRLIRELRSAMAEAKAANRAKSDFLATMSHELRTPLNTIIGLSQVLDRTAESAQDRMSAMSINSAAGRLLEMVDAILDLQKVESQAVSVQREPISLLELLHDAETLLRPLARKKGLSLHLRFASAIPERIVADKDHLKTVLLNLAGNAIKYTDQGHVWIEVGHTRSGNGQDLRVEVRDTGRGIDEADHARLFDRFMQAGGGERGAEGGVGLGLSLCRSLVELMGGEIGVSSRLGEGSTFWFTIPAAAENACAPRPHADAISPEIALLVRSQDRDRLMPGIRAMGLNPGKTIANPRDFVKARAASGDLPRYVLVVDELELDDRAITEIRHALRDAPIPPALVLMPHADNLSDWANAHLALDRGADDALIATITAWHALKPSAPASAKASEPQAEPLSVLVADDNPFNREVAKKLLGLDGHRVVFANTGEEALDALLRGGLDIAFLDINMPEGSGIDVCKEYQLAVEPDAHIPIIAMTADTSRPTAESCRRAGMAAVLHKPVQFDELRETIRACKRRAPATPVPAGANEDGPPVQEESPTLDEQRFSEIVALFGEDAFRDEMAALFRNDFEHHMTCLDEAVRRGEAASARASLHALKSAANTIGATRLAELCDDKRGADEINAALTAQITSEYTALKTTLNERMGGKGFSEHGDNQPDHGGLEAVRQHR